MSADLKLEGANALQWAFDEFPKVMIAKGVRPTLREGMKQIVLRDAKRLTPVKSGKLKRSLKVRVGKSRGNKRMPRGVVAFQVENVTTTKLDPYYGKWVFLGARNRDGSRRAGTRTLRRALYGNADALEAFVAGHLRGALPKVIDEVRRKSGAIKS